MRRHLTATITPQRNGRRVEGMLLSLRSVLAIKDGQVREYVRARIWQKPNGTLVHCSLWIHGDNDLDANGYGRAGGWGYDKSSAALEGALRTAGVTLYGDVYGQEDKKTEAHIGGCGMMAGDDALRAVAIAVGADPATVTLLYEE